MYSWYGLAEEVSQLQGRIEEQVAENRDLNELLEQYKDEEKALMDWVDTLERRFLAVKMQLEKLERSTPEEVEYIRSLIRGAVQEVAEHAGLLRLRPIPE